MEALDAFIPSIILIVIIAAIACCIKFKLFFLCAGILSAVIAYIFHFGSRYITEVAYHPEKVAYADFDSDFYYSLADFLAEGVGIFVNVALLMAVLTVFQVVYLVFKYKR